jgi:hypothetical protein
VKTARIPDGRPDPKPGENYDMTFSDCAPRGILFDPPSESPLYCPKNGERVTGLVYPWENMSLRVVVPWKIQRFTMLGPMSAILSLRTWGGPGSGMGLLTFETEEDIAPAIQERLKR